VAIVSVLFMAFLGIVFLFPGNPGVGAQDMNYSVVVVGGVMALSILWYYFPKYGGVHWFKGPIPNIHLGVDPNGGSQTPSERGVDEKDMGVVKAHGKS